MTISTLNEIFQWSAILAVLVLVLAVYRRLGLMYMDAREQKLALFGPKVGHPFGSLGNQLLTGRSFPYSLAVFTREGCSLCRDLLVELDLWEPVRSDEIGVCVAAGGSPTYVSEMRSQYPQFAVHDLREIAEEYGSTPTSYPFTFLLDRDHVVISKVLGPDMVTLIDAYESEIASTREQTSHLEEIQG